MTINPSQKYQELFQGYREVLALQKNEESGSGSASSIPVVTHNAVFEYFFANSPIHKKVIAHLEEKKRTIEKLAENAKKSA